ncbi:MAG: SDR family NAD(P)-dependent oxidoreductase [Bryobacterales bacterium]
MKPTSQTKSGPNALVEKAVGSFGKLDIVVNNAGVEKKETFVDYPFADLQKILAVNLVGPFLVAQAAARQMIRQGHGGRVINISSVHEDLPSPTNAAYCASKGRLRMLTRTIAIEASGQDHGQQHRAWRGLHADRCGHRGHA